MSDQNQNDTISFDLPKNQSSVIKVIGVGGGGSNAVNHMFGMGIRGVDFAVSNTDAQALSNSPVPNKIQLGVTLTEGLGAGANPEIGEQAAQESIQDIKNLLETHTKMVFITAGMGGGTGTGAAPVIAKVAKDMGILTVGIVTMPFLFEGSNRKQQAERGVEALRNNVDSLIVINNNKLREVYGNLGFKAGFAKADEVLATASRGIAEVITHHYTTNIDLRDARTVLADSGTAIMGSSSASGENRAGEAISKALDSPLLNDNHIKGAKNVLLLIVSGKEEITIDEIGEINDHIQAEAGGSANIIMGIGDDESLGNDIAVTIVATGFNADQQVQVIGGEPQKVVHTLEDEQPVSTSIYNKPVEQEEHDEDDMIMRELAKADDHKQDQTKLFTLEEEPAEPEVVNIPASEIVKNDPEPTPAVEEIEDDSDLNFEKFHAEEDEDDTESEPLFSIGEDNDEVIEESHALESVEPDTNTREDIEPVVSSKETVPEKEEEKAVRYSLEDYMKLEEKLQTATPAKNSENEPKVKTEEVDKDLEFELKKLPEDKSNSDNNAAKHSPMDGTIADSMRNRARERRATLKSFNYRFKNHPYSSEDPDKEPAYKRQGVKIEDEKYSSANRMGRFTIDDSEDGGNIKTNNSFLHDNVD